MKSDSDDTYNKMDKLMLLLAQPRCIAAGCSPKFNQKEKYANINRKSESKCEKQISMHM